ncbi:MAG: hypothetical protein QF384_00030 [Alphaproteobacteria bacterium]|jgi:hypothetical protein|nr:hypothetical protein [Alphaproteobacteria bacterium]MDP6687862.1 hypothetical protein [Alphaproteobacteria bacterium]|tara:strand:+ start:70 stop:459 length:390 start_codon:yes stop_codon:yes gene_type:complete
MNGYLLLSGAVAAFMLVGHCTIGRKQFFLPMLEVSFDATSKRVMEFVWHMATASLVLPPLALFYAGTMPTVDPTMRLLVAFVAAQFAAWGLVHLSLVATSGLPGAIYRMFQWSLFLIVAASAAAGLLIP